MSGLPVTQNGFDYSTVPTDDAQAAFAAATRIKCRMARTALDIIEIGRDLIEVKKLVGHGHFLKWIDAEFGMTDRTALNFMNAADTFGSKTEIISDLPPTVLYALAAPSTPEEVRTEIVERAERGEKVVAADVRELKAKIVEKDERLRTLKTQKQSADTHNSRLIDDIRSKTNECQRLSETIENLREEIRRLNEPGTITVTPQPVENGLGKIDDDFPYSTAQTLLDLYNALSPDLQAEFLRKRPVAATYFPEPASDGFWSNGPSAGHQPRRQRDAAVQLVAALSKHFDDTAIADLNALWKSANWQTVADVLRVRGAEAPCPD